MSVFLCSWNPEVELLAPKQAWRPNESAINVWKGRVTYLSGHSHSLLYGEAGESQTPTAPEAPAGSLGAFERHQNWDNPAHHTGLVCQFPSQPSQNIHRQKQIRVSGKGEWRPRCWAGPRSRAYNRNFFANVSKPKSESSQTRAALALKSAGLIAVI